MFRCDLESQQDHHPHHCLTRREDNIDKRARARMFGIARLWRVASGLRDRGLFLRALTVWAQPNSVKSRRDAAATGCEATARLSTQHARRVRSPQISLRSTPWRDFTNIKEKPSSPPTDSRFRVAVQRRPPTKPSLSQRN